MQRRSRRLRAGIAQSTVALALTALLVGVEQATPAYAATSITIDGTKSGRVFDGVGALSAGASSRLLVDYPEPQRSQILDYLFKPGYGANLQILKVEVGGDTNSTDGAEPSARHTTSDTDYQRGYEWWLMKEAKARNPGIKFSALAWGAPGWVGGGSFWSTDMVDYYVDWLKHAQSDHGITIDTIGGWNERGYDKAWYINLHNALRAANLSTKVVASDDFGWSVADAMAADPAFAASVDIIGAHYSCGYLSAMTQCSSSATAKNSGKTLWSSENGSLDMEAGAQVARAINRGYLDAKTTAYINWPPVASIYPNLTWQRTGLMLANQPWSGAYQLGSSLWATAHTTQVTAPGWHYIDSASGFLAGDRNNGSYVTLASPNGRDYSTVIETLDADAAETVTFTIAGGLSTGPVHVWASDFGTGTYFAQQDDLTPSGGSYTVTLQPGRIYSLTTTSGQGHGTATGNARANLALPYADDFDGYAPGKLARYLADMQGSFETAACGGGRAGRCVRQMATTKPIEWNVDSEPFALLGDGAWTDYTLAADVYFEQAGSAELIARAGKQASGQGTMDGYYLVVGSGGAWSIQRNTWRGTGRVTLCSGTVAAPGTGSWHRLGLTANGNVLTATLDGATLGSVTDATYGHGQIGIGTGGYQTVQFDNLSVSPLRADYGQAWHAIENRGSGKVLEVPGASTADGVLVDQRTDSGGAAQKWALLADGSGYVKVVNRNSGKVLDDPGWSTAAGTQLDQWADAGSANEQWLAQEHADGTVTLTNRYSGLVADVSGASGADGAPVIQWPDHGGANQRWLLKAEFTPGRTYAIVNRAGGKVLEVPGASTSDGTRIDQWTYFSSVGHHHWRVEPTDSGYVKFINVNSGKALDNTGASPAVNNPLEQWTDIGVANEQWQVVPVGAGYYQLRNRQSGLVATVLNPGPGDGEGAPVVQAAPSGPASEWLFLQM